jgi:hypothetical protein
MHKDALTDRVTISTIGKSKDSIGQEKKVPTVLYADAPCRLMEDSKSRLRKDEGADQNLKNLWLIHMQAIHNGASREDRAVINGQTYIITKKHEIRGASSVIQFVIYYLEEKT